MHAKNTFATQSLALLLVGNAVVLVTALQLAAPYLSLGIGAVVTLLIWYGLQRIAGPLLQAPAEAAPAPLPEAETPPQVEAPPRPVVPEQPPEAAALQLLALLQREGRLLDFLQEDIRPFDDAQIGAAVRPVHAGCQAALATHLPLAPIRTEAEGSTVTLQEGFDAHAVRLSGHVSGTPPFTGTLQHRGWRVTEVDLPALMQRQDRVVAPAEVSVG
ncbi:MAG: DUF2760 domain-containing protein [Bacteroidota bacterium]